MTWDLRSEPTNNTHERKICRMKIVSIKEFIEELENISGTDFYKERRVKDSEENASVEMVETRGIKFLADIFATIDVINSIDVDKSHKVIDCYKLEDYSVIAALKPFIRDGKVVAGSEEDGVKLVDIMTPYQNFSFNEGEVLTPEEFETTQFKLLRFINYKYSSLGQTYPITREVVSVTGAMINTYPTIMNDNSVMAIVQTKTPNLYPLSFPLAREDEYGVTVGKRLVKLVLSDIARAMVAEAGIRNGGGNIPSTNLKGTDGAAPADGESAK